MKEKIIVIISFIIACILNLSGVIINNVWFGLGGLYPLTVVFVICYKDIKRSKD